MIEDIKDYAERVYLWFRYELPRKVYCNRFGHVNKDLGLSVFEHKGKPTDTKECKVCGQFQWYQNGKLLLDDDDLFDDVK